MVLLRAETIVQQNRCRPLSHVRSYRLRPPESRPCRRHPASEGRQETRRAIGKLANCRTGEALWQSPDTERLKGKRYRALLAVLLACGLRRHEAVELSFSHLQQREQHWAIVDLIGKGGHIRTVPMPDWVKAVLDVWLTGAGITSGRLFRHVNRARRVWGESMTERLSGISSVISQRKPRSTNLRRMTYAGRARDCVTQREANSNRYNFCLAASRSKPRSDTSAASNVSGPP